MKRRIALLALLLAPLAACMPGLQHPADSPDVVYESAAPLRARLLNGAGGLAVNVSQAAHVAVFEVVPGQGLGLVYPAYGSERGRFTSGYNRIFTNRVRPYTWYYTGGVPGDRLGPRYYLLVASRLPLRIDQFQGDASAMRHHFGLRRFAALNPRPAMDELVNLVVPEQADEDWDTDVLTVWPQDDVDGLDDRRLVRVVCNNGHVITTEWENAQYACTYFNRPPQQTPPQQTPPQRPDTTGGESSDSVKVPTKRRPEPRSADDEPGSQPRERARVANWRETDRDGNSSSTTGVRRPQPRGSGEDEGGSDEEPTPSVRRVPTAPRDPEPQDGGRRDEPTERREAPRSPAGTGGSGSETTRAEPRHESPRAEPRREAPRETPRETPRAEPPSRTEPVRSEPARVEAPRPAASSSPAASAGGNGETR